MTSHWMLSDLDLSYAGIGGMDVSVHEGHITLRLLDVRLPGASELEDAVLIRCDQVRFFRGIRSWSGPAELVLTTLEELDAHSMTGVTWSQDDRFFVDFGWARSLELNPPGMRSLSDYPCFRLSCGDYTAEWLAASYSISIEG